MDNLDISDKKKSDILFNSMLSNAAQAILLRR